MKILTLNCGSSSIKYKLLDMNLNTTLAQGGIEKIGMPDSFLKFTLSSDEKVVLEKQVQQHQTGIEFILEVICSKEYGCIHSLSEIDAVGHRVVHGGEKFNSSVIINDEVIDKIKECIDLAPLHNPANLSGIEAVNKLMPEIPQIAVFDTAFHQTMPDYAFRYALPYSLYEKYMIRRYGFHGTSHRYVSERACEFLGLPYEKQRIITCHIGNGASIAAICNGKVQDTSMGMTPMEGLMMGTRSGDVDAGVLAYVMEKEQMEVADLLNLINKDSGVLGVSGVSSDMREIHAAIDAGNEKAILALKMYNYRIKKYIGSYIAALGGVDVLVFTGGVGENQIGIREQACCNLEFLGISLDAAANRVRGEEAIISTPDSKVKVVVIPTDEEYMIALETVNILK